MTTKIIRVLILAMAIKFSFGNRTISEEKDSYEYIDKPIPRIIGGKESGKRELHSLIALRKRVISRRKTAKQLCGGSIINEYCILTAAHCFPRRKSRPYLYDFIVAVHNVTGYENEPQAKKYLVKKIIVHPLYREVGTGNDVAIVCTDTPIQYNEHVEPAILPKAKDSDKCKTATIYGWGLTVESGKKSSDILRKVDVPVITNDRCKEKYKKDYQIYENQICCGYDTGGMDSCQGDSGGPLICNEGVNNGTLIGVVSFGIGCARAAFPGVFMRVSHFLKWIEENTNDFLEDFINY